MNHKRKKNKNRKANRAIVMSNWCRGGTKTNKRYYLFDNKKCVVDSMGE